MLAALPLSLAGCSWDLLNPSGSIGVQTRNLIVLATALMLMVVIPVIILTLVFAWRYRESNTKAEYAPRWSHSTRIEVVVWGIPCVIVALLGIIIWDTTHSSTRSGPIESKVAPLEVDVVALDWKWLFIYPQYGDSLAERAARAGGDADQLPHHGRIDHERAVHPAPGQHGLCNGRHADTSCI